MFIPPGWSAAEVEHELIEPPTRAFVRFPALEVVSRPDWAQLTCQLFPAGGFNEVSRAKLSDESADRLIDETLAHYANRGLTFRWSVMPGSTPSDLAARLAARGLESTEIAGMACATALDHPPSPGVTVQEIGLDRLDDYSRIMAQGWGAPLGALNDYHHVALSDPQRAQRFFLATCEGEPAAVASATIFPRSIYLLGAVVLPRFRRRGVYGALIAARLSLARTLGIPLATSHAIASTSAPLLERAGFDTWFRFLSFSPPRHAEDSVHG
ncbi:MAG: GNAT family N-acetyltransferase [Archangium sp.]|nr:GNAT family N-acetyltransferase [Archangium sp.]MDP3570819.1 GNAT family N-acetyltransferase [Archangium sp.]